ncbi:MAG: type II toxin-antitoxin system HipA family toxin [Pseudomonadota bacterium]
MAGRPSKSRVLDVWMNGELVGEWQLRGNDHQFAYAEAWLSSASTRPLSLSLPLTQGATPFAGDIVENYFDNLLPDSLDIRKRVATRFGASSTKAFDLIEKIGRDCVGAVQLMAHGASPVDVRNIRAQPLSEAAIEQLLNDTVAAQTLGSDDEDDALRISLAGAQEKTALLLHEGQWCRPLGATPTTHILKLPLGQVGRARADFSSSVENEWLCSRLALAFGLPAAESHIEQFGASKVLVVERFDRKFLGTWWARLPQEDFCQVAGIGSGLKYENQGGPGMAAILGKLRGSARAASDRETFLASQLFFWLLAAPDGHAKNFSIFLEQGGAYRLTPLYDVLSAWPAIGDGPNMFQWQKVTMAMAVRAGNAHYKMGEISRRHWNAAAKSNAVGADFEPTIERFIGRAQQAIAEVAAQLPDNFPAHVSDSIFEGVLRQVSALQRQA